MSIRSHCLAIIMALFVFTLTACGGGGKGGEPSPTVKVLSQPGDVVVTTGQPANFSVSSGGAYTVQWQRLVNGIWVNIPGATNERYTLTNAQASDDDASFKAVLTPLDGGPAVSSSPVKLRVVAQAVAPALIVMPGDQTLTAGQPATFAVTATGTSLTYRWQKRGDADVDFTDIQNALDATLVLAAIGDSDDGAVYRVVISNVLGSVTSTPARLTVRPALSAPVFTTVPSGVPVVDGQPASFIVAVTGHPVPALGWQRSTDGGATWTDITGQTSTTLTLPAVSGALNGTQYRAVATNASGTVFSPPAFLVVQAVPVAPFIVSQSTDVTVGAGSTAYFVVVAGGTPAPSLQWQVSLDGGTTFTNITGATSAELGLPSVTVADSGKKLRVLAHGSAGSTTSQSVTLTVRPGPQITRQPQPQAWRAGLPLPTFSVGAAGSGLSYQWQTSESQGSGFRDIVSATASTLTTFTPPSRDSWIRVIVRNAAGDATISAPARLAKLTWIYQSPMPTGDTMRALVWGSDSLVVGAGQGGTVIRSTDAGLSWSTVRESNGQSINSMAFGSPSVGVAVGTENGQGLILRTADGGLHWEQMPGAPDDELVSVAFHDAGTALAVGRRGTMLRSLDGGLNWTPVNTGVTADWVGVAFRAGLGIAVNDDGHIFRSINGGAQWQKTFLPPRGTSRTRQAISFATDSTVVIANQLGVNRSTDGGQTWQETYGPVYWGTSAMAFANADQGVALSVHSHLPAYTTNDGGINWSESFSWPRGFDGTAIALRGNVGVAAGDQGRLYRTTDGGQTWTVLTPQMENLRGASFGSPAVGVVIGDKTLYRTSDGGAHWTVVGTNLTPPALGHTWQQVAFLDPTTVIAIDSTGRTARSTDGGVNWSFSNSIPLPYPFRLGFMTFSSANVGWLMVNDALRRTTDGGMTWQDVPAAAYTCIREIIVPSSTAYVMSLACDGSIQRSLDGGQSWQTVYLDNDHANLQIAFANESLGIAVGRYGRMLRTTNGGTTWTPLSPPDALRSVHITQVWFVSATIGYMVGESGGIYRTSDGGLTWALDNWRSSFIQWGIKTSDSSFVGVSYSGLVLRRSELE